MFELKNLPNRITMSRIVMIFVFVILANIRDDAPGFFIPQVSCRIAEICHQTAYIVAIVAGLTDFLDGYLARKFHLENDFGRLMDPLADKIFVVCTFVMMAEYKLMPGWIIIIVLTREFMVTGLRMLASSKGIVISADKLGKYKTALQMGCLVVGGGAWAFESQLRELTGFYIFNEPYWAIWYIILILMTALTLISGINYFRKHKEIYLEYT